MSILMMMLSKDLVNITITGHSKKRKEKIIEYKKFSLLIKVLFL